MGTPPGECPLTAPGGQASDTTPSAGKFPVIPVAIGAGALLVLVALARG